MTKIREMRTKSLKKCRTMTSLEEVESNEELLMAILVRLPPKPISKFKCVSKRWNNMLIDPYFRKSYSLRIRNDQPCGNGVGRILAFFQDRKRFLRGPGPHQLFNMLPTAQHKIKELPFVNSSLVHCTDGLILFQKNSSRYFVVNPVNRTWVKLPPSNYRGLSKLGLVCIENKGKLMPSFRVVGIARGYDRLEPKTISIETYSSETQEWKTSKLVYTEKVNNQFRFLDHPFVYNGVFHWRFISSGPPCLAVYDSNVDECNLQFIKLPLNAIFDFALTRSPRDDVLWVGMGNCEMIRFWILPKDENGCYKRKTTVSDAEWILIYTIDKESLSKELALLLERKNRKRSVCDETVGNAVSSLKLEALIPWNPLVAVLSMRQKVFLYNLDTKSTELVKYLGRPVGGNATRWYPFMESLYLSTYARFASAYD